MKCSTSPADLVYCRVVATAAVYFRRFYLRENFAEFDPRCVAPACLYLACKSEESQVQAKLLHHIVLKLQQNGECFKAIHTITKQQSLEDSSYVSTVSLQMLVRREISVYAST